MRHIDLFSGIGGFVLAATWVWGDEYENVGHSEIESYPCKVYHRHFPESECLGDITKIDWTRYAGTIDLVTGGFPCQPHSVAGKRKGDGDERDLWSECVRAIRELRPRFALFENVPGLFTSNGGQFFQRVLTDISESGYDCEWQVLSAAEVGAWHKRERVWILSYPTVDDASRNSREFSQSDEQQKTKRQKEWVPESCGSSDVCHTERGGCSGQSWRRSGAELTDRHSRMEEADVSDTKGAERERAGDSRNGRNGLADVCENASDSVNTSTARQRIDSREVYAKSESKRFSECYRSDWWAVEPNVGRVAHGVSSRVDRLKALGNAIVPQCAAVIMQKIKKNM